MTAPSPHPAHLQRLAQECAQLSYRTSQIAAELAALQQPSPPPPVPTPVPVAAPPGPPVPSRRPWLSRAADDGRLVGAVLAVAGVAVTVVGVGLLLVLAAQAGLLSPGVRVAAGAVFAACLVGLAVRLHARGGQVGAVALAATGVATAYLDVIAVTRLYHWVPAVVGLVLAAGIAGGGVAWARRWRSERLAIISAAPLIGVAPLVAGGVDLGLVGFLLVIALACVAVSHRTPWTVLPVVGVAGASLWVTAAVVVTRFAAHEADGVLLAAACALTAMTGLAAGLSAVTRRLSPTAAAVASVAGCVPALVSGLAVERLAASSVMGAVAIAAAVLVVWSPRGVPPIVRATWACLAAGATVLAVPTAVAAPVAVPALLAIAAVVTVVGRADRLVAAVGAGLTGVATLGYLGWSVPFESLVTPVVRGDGQVASAVVASLLLMGAAAAVASVFRALPGVTIGAGVAALYGLTATVVTVGVALGGTGGGFLAGHMVATVLWVLAAAGILGAASRLPAGEARRVPIGAALALAGGAIAKLITFDLATLDGAFRVGAFVAAGVLLLAVGTRQARTRSTSA